MAVLAASGVVMTSVACASDLDDFQGRGRSADPEQITPGQDHPVAPLHQTTVLHFGDRDLAHFGRRVAGVIEQQWLHAAVQAHAPHDFRVAAEREDRQAGAQP